MNNSNEEKKREWAKEIYVAAQGTHQSTWILKGHVQKIEAKVGEREWIPKCGTVL